MNKGTVIRAGIIFGLFVVILVTMWAVGTSKDKNDTPSLTNPDEVYLTVGDITITKQELWDKIRLTEGVTYLEQYIEENYFFATEISEVTQAEIDALVQYYQYGTNDADAIAEIREDAELEADLLATYENSLRLLGFDPTDAADVRAFMQLEIAKANYAYDAVLAADEDSSIAITDYELETYYDSHNLGEVCALNVVFNSANEATAIFNKLNIIPNYNQGWGLYTGTEDISTLGTGDFTETNTEEMEAEEVFEAYVDMYNEMNPNNQIADTESVDTFCTNYADDFTYDYLDMTEDKLTGDPYITLADYLFETLGLGEDDARYSFTLQAIGEFEVLSYKVSESGKSTYYIDNPAYDEVAAAADEDYDVPKEIISLTDAEIAVLKVEILEETLKNASSKAQLLNEATSLLWDAAEFEIFDPVMKVKYLESNAVTFDNKGSEEVVAVFNGNDITADDLYEYIEAQIGTYYSIDLIKNKAILASDAFTDLYEDDYDYVDSDREEYVEFRDELRLMKNSFSSGSYATYGYDPTTYTWDDFMLLAFYALDEAQAIENYYVINSLLPYFVIDSVDYDSAETIIQDQIDEYFNLNVMHLLVYVDFDQDLTPDAFNDYVEELAAVDLDEYNSLKADLEALIENKLNDDMTFEEIVDAFNDGLMSDPANEWAVYKEFGFKILTQDLSSSASLSPATTVNYDEDFVVAVKDLYDDYIAINNASTEDLDELYYDELFQSDFGLHYLYSTPGSAFDMPSAEYSEADDVQSVYPETANNDDLIPSQDQVDLYVDIEFASMTSQATDAALPTSVYSAIDAYWGTTFDTYFSTGGYTIAAVNYILDNSPAYATNNADRLAYIETVLEIMYESNFADGFIIPE